MRMEVPIVVVPENNNTPVGSQHHPHQEQRLPLRKPAISLVRTMLPMMLLLLLPVTSSAASTAPPAQDLFSIDQERNNEIPEVSHCNVEDLEIANDSQLYSILTELKQTNFFRSFAVDLTTPCPLANNGRKVVEQAVNEEDTNKKSDDNKKNEAAAPLPPEPEEEGSCASEGLPDLDPDAKPACHVEEEDPFGGGFGGTSSSSTTSSFATSTTTTTSSAPPKSSNDDDKDDDDDSTKKAASSSDASSSEKEPVPDDASDDATATEEEADCDGGAVSDEMDPDDEPLCTLKHDGDFTQPIRSLIAMALESIRYFGWESESQRETYQWSKTTDPVATDEQCDENGQLPDVFWNDMCASSYAAGGGRNGKVVNLVLNPERNTGYNGTHIWNAIYQENCLSDEELCYEERVLYRLLSGLHTSTSLSIAKHYYPPSKRKNRTNWEPNPSLFMETFQDHPDRLRNLHFSYVVLLRALSKAAPVLDHFSINTGNIVDDEMASRLLQRLLDSAILKTCQSVFTAFDERLMFQNDDSSAALQQNFKGVFYNISSILDCVQCQQCKLHGKLTMLGYSAALKILFSSGIPVLTQNEVVAFVNTVAKFSESIKEVRELSNLYWKEQQQESSATTSNTAASAASSVELADAAMGLIARLSQEQDDMTAAQEATLVELAMKRDDNLLLLVKHYGGITTDTTTTTTDKFWSLAKTTLLLDVEELQPDAIIVGSGLAGLAAALNILDRGGTVTIVEKEHLLGGNSNKASSGINACCLDDDGNTDEDVLESFRNDTIRSAGAGAQPALVQVLVDHSASAVSWLRNRVGVDLSLKAQLGGHSYKRTHRPNNGMAGAEIIYGMQKAVKQYAKEGGRVTILVDTKVTKLVTNDEGRVVGVETDSQGALYATNVVLATGGFAADRSAGSYLEQVRPEFLNMPATAGAFSTGDGIGLGTTLGAGTIDMDKVQIHPTGWVDPKDPDNKSKILAAELMRGVGGILLNNRDGTRFCNELGTRAYVTNQMLAQGNPEFEQTQQWNRDSPIPTFSLVLSASAALDGKKHVDLYTHKGLLTKLVGLTALANWMQTDVDVLRNTYAQYAASAAQGKDEFGKTSFRGLPTSVNLEEEVFYAGTVTPVLHYCMGGLTIDTEGNVLSENGVMIQGLHAAGEVTGGVHGHNRLGGNSLLECTVFGTIVGKKLPIQERIAAATAAVKEATKQEDKKQDRIIALEEVEEHNDEDGDCWVIIHGVVYDLTEFAEEHPGGAESIHVLCGTDGTEAFSAVHNAEIMEDYQDERMGRVVDSSSSS